MTPDKVEAALATIRACEAYIDSTGTFHKTATVGSPLREFQQALATLTEALAERERDAARYRWLRNDPPVTLCVRRHPGETERGCYLDGLPLDQAIDAAMKETPTVTANKKSPTGDAAPKGAMPEMPEAVGYVGSDMTGRIGVVLPAGTFLYTADQVQEYGNGRHDEGYADGYLAGLEAAKACVPEVADEDAYQYDRAEQYGHNNCRNLTLTNLTALEQEAKK